LLLVEQVAVSIGLVVEVEQVVCVHQLLLQVVVAL
jgi:hypothetical protein